MESINASATTTVSLPLDLAAETARFDRNGNLSQFVEQALVHYLHELKEGERAGRDAAIIKKNAERFAREAEENLEFQDIGQSSADCP
jgi:hypothetical protein